MSGAAIKVKMWMNPPEHTVDRGTTVEEAFAVMAREGIRHLLVVDESEELVGVVTDRDLRRPTIDGEVMTVEAMYKVGEALKVRDVMTASPMTVGPETHAAEAARMMVENKFNCLPVVDRDGGLVGITTSVDLLSALVHETDPLAAELEAS
ncbi:MAG: CBS domain-containing protein [Myxococcota bacterium]